MGTYGDKQELDTLFPVCRGVHQALVCLIDFVFRGVPGDHHRFDWIILRNNVMIRIGALTIVLFQVEHLVVHERDQR